MSTKKNNCIAFPSIHSLERIRINNLDFISTNNIGDKISDDDKRIVSVLPTITNLVFNFRPTVFQFCIFESTGSPFQVLEQIYPHLLLFRFLILSNGLSHDYSDSEFLFFQLETGDIQRNEILHCFVNGLEPSPISIGNYEEQSRLTQQSRLFSHGPIVEGYSNKFNQLDESIQKVVTKGLQRFVLAHAPLRHTDDFGRILSFVAGIEILLDLDKNDGADQFGKKLEQV